MAQYERKILNGLLDSYENSLLFTGENKVSINIAYPFTKKSVPEYFDESSLAYDEIHASMKALEVKGYIRIVWKRADHIISKVLLNEAQIPAVYGYVRRVPKADHIERMMQLLTAQEQECRTKIAGRFIRYLKERIRSGESVKEYVDLADRERTGQLIRAIRHIEENREVCYIREFSIRCFGDSKVLESLLGVIGKAMGRFGDDYQMMDVYGILAEYYIYHTPNYVYVKGDSGILKLAGTVLDLGGLKQGIGISGEDVPLLQIAGVERIRKVITIENLTTFFRWQETDAMIIYLGGYHNAVRRELLQLIYRQLPQVRYLHFGDIDAGGFEIYEDLCRKTGIAFEPYYMDLSVLKSCIGYAKPLTAHDRKRLERLREKYPHREYGEVLAFMLECGVKLEQECIVV